MNGQREPELVVLVHGMGRTPLAMLPLARSLRRQGFDVLNFGYSSYGPSIEQIGRRLQERLTQRLMERPVAAVHFVGHSLGNIIIRWLLEHARPEPLGRVVMLAPPNRGARVADRLAPYLKWLLKAIAELTTDADGMAVRMAPPRGVAQAIIAGSRDGKVRVEETRLPGATAHRIVAAGHTFIMMKREVQALVARFLCKGSLE